MELAAAQHSRFIEALESCNYNVTTLPPLPEYPDSVFVEDTALILPEAALLLPLGVSSRAGESERIADQLKKHREVVRIEPPARADGGDLLLVGRHLFVGMSSRTDRAGFEALSKIADRFGYEITPVTVSDALHLKTAVTSLDDETLLLNPDWVDAGAFKDFRLIEVDESEPNSGCVVRAGDTIIAHPGFEGTFARIADAGYNVIGVDISEFHKCEAAMTCLALLID